MKAERLFKSVMQRLLSGGTDAEDNKVVEMSLKLANIYSKLGKDKEAVLGFRFCIDAQEKKIKKGSKKRPRPVSRFREETKNEQDRNLILLSLFFCRRLDGRG